MNHRAVGRVSSSYFCKWWRSGRSVRACFSSSSSSSSSSVVVDPKIKEDGDLSWTDKLLYSSFLQKHQPNRSFRIREKFVQRTTDALEVLERNSTAHPIALKYLLDETVSRPSSSRVGGRRRKEGRVRESQATSVTGDGEEEPFESGSFPFQNVTGFEYVSEEEEEQKMERECLFSDFESEAKRMTKAGIDVGHVLKSNSQSDVNTLSETSFKQLQSEYGTPDLSMPVSDVPCGGCGAKLHCQDPKIPGYISSERFKMLRKQLSGELCLRCFCFSAYNTALNVNISAADYPKILRQIEDQFAMVILVVDLTDFPCSIWPGLVDIIGTKRPVFLVGNKVDLIPRDSERHLDRITDILIKMAKEAGLESAKVVHTSVVSAMTGFGIEDLITAIHRIWGHQGDIFIMGCTNVGKSSLFNTLVQSDLCKAEVVDLVQRATVSQWPGTTLSLLKFPILRIDTKKEAIRLNRLSKETPDKLDDQVEALRMLRQTKDPKYGVLSGTVGRSFLSDEILENIENVDYVRDPFRLRSYKRPPPSNKKIGDWDPKNYYLQGNWCYDTPGVVNENQLLDLFTLAELGRVLPKKQLQPKTYFIYVGMSVFIGGFARIDYIDGFKPIRYTVFCSEEVPVTIVKIEDANEIYRKALGTPILGIPMGNLARLSKFPNLEPRDHTFIGEGHKRSCGDIVVSSAGWVAVTCGIDKTVHLRIHSPGGRGVYVRRPAIVPYAVNSKGPRIRGTMAYLPHDIYVPRRNHAY